MKTDRLVATGEAPAASLEPNSPMDRIWTMIASEIERAACTRSYQPKRIDALVKLVCGDIALLYAEPTPNSKTETARLKSDLECEKV